jgi:curved DNA-binding protein CbpA
MEKDYYDILGVPKDASEEDIKRAYHILAHQFHPDRPDGSERRFKAVNEAYRILSDSRSRAEYDREFTNDESSHFEKVEDQENRNEAGSGVARGILLILLIGLVSVGVYFAVTSSNAPQSSSNQASSAVSSPVVSQNSNAQLASSDNNPGLLKDSSGNLISYGSPANGYAALLNYLQAIMNGTSPTGLGPNSTLSNFSDVYASASGDASPSQYAVHLASQLGVSTDVTMGSLQSNIGKLADAIAENNGFTDLNKAQSQGTPSNASVALTPSLINQIEPSIVEVNCYSADGSMVSSGSGVSAHRSSVDDNYIETNYHVVGDAVINGQAPSCYAVYPEAPDFLYNESYGDYELTLSEWHYNPDIYQDVAFLTVGASVPNTTPLNQIPVINDFYKSVRYETADLANASSSFCSPSEVDVGDTLTVFGYPHSGNALGISETITKGSIAGILPGPIYKTDAPIDHGNSGGFAILDKDLCSLGIPTLGESGLTAGIGYIQAYTLANSGQ